MLQIQQGPAAPQLSSGISRRTALKAGFLGLAGLTLPDLLRLRAEGSAEKKDTAVILLWLDGGPSQLETYDPKPDAPADYRGPYKAIQTNVPGIRVYELLANHARHMDKMVLVRSLHHDNGDHFAAAHWMLTGRFGSTAASLPQKYPSVGSYAARVARRQRSRHSRLCRSAGRRERLPLPRLHGRGVPRPDLQPVRRGPRTEIPRRQLAKSRSAGRRSSTTSPQAQARQSRKPQRPARPVSTRCAAISTPAARWTTLDRYQQEALEHDPRRQGPARLRSDQGVRIGCATATARDRGASTRCMARRLVEAGVTFVTVDMPQLGRPFEHQGGPRLQIAAGGHGRRRPARRPERARPARSGAGGGHGRVRPARRRSTRANRAFRSLAAITGATPSAPCWPAADSRADRSSARPTPRPSIPSSEPLKPADLLATVYHVLGIDPTLTFKDHTGRPVPILDEGKAIDEVI